MYSSLLLIGFCRAREYISHISVCSQLAPNPDNVTAYCASQATGVSKAASLAIIHEAGTVAGNKHSCLLTSMFVRENGRGSEACCISCGSQAGLGSLFSVRGFSIALRAGSLPDFLIGPAAGCMSIKMCSQVWWKVQVVEAIMDLWRTKRERERTSSNCTASVLRPVGSTLWFA